VACAVCCMSPPGWWAVGPNPASKQPKAKTQPNLHNTQTTRNSCRFGVVCGVCSVLRVASGLLGCRVKTNQQTTQPNATAQPTLHNTHTIHNDCRFIVVCGVCCVLRVASGLLAWLSGGNPRAHNPRQQHNQHYTTQPPYTRIIILENTD
jgi:hypothetical protein